MMGRMILIIGGEVVCMEEIRGINEKEVLMKICLLFSGYTLIGFRIFLS